MVSKKCYNYKGKFCKDWKALGTIPKNSPLCETACNNDSACRGHFTYLGQNDELKSCFHCTGKGKNPDIDKPISPFPLLTDNAIQDLEICYNHNDLKQNKKCSWDDLNDTEKESISNDISHLAKSNFQCNCPDVHSIGSWEDLSTEDKKKALKKGCNIDYISQSKLDDYLRSTCKWEYIDKNKKNMVLEKVCPPASEICPPAPNCNIEIGRAHV